MAVSTNNASKKGWGNISMLYEEFNKRRQLLVSVRNDDTKLRITGFLNWMEEQHEVSIIINSIRNAVNVDNIMESCNINYPPQASTQEEIIAVGLHLMESCRDGDNLGSVAYKYGIKSTYSPGSYQDCTDEAFERYIDPALDFIENELLQKENELDIESVMDSGLSTITHSILPRNFPLTLDRLQKIAEYLRNDDNEGEWYNVGNSCREVFKTYIDEIKSFNLIELNDNIQAANIKNIISKAIITGSKSRFDDTLVKLVSAAWDHCQTITHRPTSTKKQAVRLYIWTTMTIGELAFFINDAVNNE